MKVNDLTNEGIVDLVRRVQLNRQTGAAQRATAQRDKKSTDLTYQEWIAQMSRVPGLDAANVDTELVKWADSRFKMKPGTTKIPAPAIGNLKDNKKMYDYIMSRTKEYYSNLSSPVTSAPTAGTAVAASTAPNLASDVKIINLDPIILRYRNVDFSLDDTGQWHAGNSKKPVAQAWAKFLDQQHNIAIKSAATTTPESIELTEGGNAIPSSEPVAKDDVANVVTLAKKYLPPQLAQGLQTDIGSAGYKVASGDIDLMIDAEQVVKFFKTDSAKDPILTAKQALKAYFENQGLESNVKGRNVHIGIKYRDRAGNKPMTAQVDIMVISQAEQVAPWHQHGMRGQYADPEFKGSDLFVLISSIAKAMNLKFDAFGGKLMNRDTGEVVARSRGDVAKILLNPRAQEKDLDSVKSILRALENDPDKEMKLAQARQDAANGVLKLPEVAPPGTAAWFNDRVNRLL